MIAWFWFGCAMKHSHTKFFPPAFGRVSFPVRTCQSAMVADLSHTDGGSFALRSSSRPLVPVVFFSSGPVVRFANYKLGIVNPLGAVSLERVV